MSKKRKDNKGRVPWTGESQRADGSYDFRYTDRDHQRCSIYAKDLETLREREAEIQLYLDAGVNVCVADITVEELLKRYVSLKRGGSPGNPERIPVRSGCGGKYSFGQRKIGEIRMSDAKLWFIELYDDGYSWNTIASIRGVVKPAFQMAFTEELIRRNPFDFRLDIIPNDTEKRVALSKRQQRDFLNFIAEDKHYSQYLDEIVVLLGTGMRVSEFCGLTMADLDFERRRIRVDHQLVWTRICKRYVEKTKTECGCRFLPMSDEVYRSLYNILSRRVKPQKEPMIDGYTGFILLDQNGNPKVALHIEHVVKRIWQKYNEAHVIPLPRVTPHVFRHTFCTNMANAGMDLKSLQYLMGHSDVSVTLNVYTHTSYAQAEQSMQRILGFTPQPERKMG